jgi:internalin A
MKIVLAFFSGSIWLFQLLPVVADSTSSKPTKSFQQWCQEKASVNIATRRTINALLKQAGTKNCQVANDRLVTKVNLSINHSQISDLQPLSSLSKLEILSLENNQISDLRPLANLTKLNLLNLNHNKIANLQPLVNLNNLSELELAENQIKDLTPLTELQNLTELNLYKNQIVELKSLTGLKNLMGLDLRKNLIINIESLFSLNRLKDVRLTGNLIPDRKLKELVSKVSDRSKYNGRAYDEMMQE